MAVKASAVITISKYRDTESVTRYYKLQSSTAATPSKPTTKPPSGWTDTEPSYTSGSTNTLYFCDLSVFSDGAWSYSSVSKSSSYEAAKEAYNKAVAAGNTADTAKNTANNANSTANKTQAELDSFKKDNLIRNGYGEEKSNANMNTLTFDGSNTYENVPSFKRKGNQAVIWFGDTLIPVDTLKEYEFSMNIKASGTDKAYLGWGQYDVDRQYIEPGMQYGYAVSETTLAQDLKDGDTVVHLTSASGFSTGFTAKHQLGLAFWNYKDSTGYLYEPGVYTRNVWYDLYLGSSIDKTNNTITLKTAWNHGTFPAGTIISQSNSSGYKYFNFSNEQLPTEWTNTSLVIAGTQEPYTYGIDKFNPATKFVRFMMYHNYQSVGGADATTYFNSIRFFDRATKTNAENIDSVKETATDTAGRVAVAESTIETLSDMIATMVTDENGLSLMTQTSAGWTFNIGALQKSLEDAHNNIQTANGSISQANSAIDGLNKLVKDISDKTAYIVMSTDENGDPCIELGKAGNDFKVRITNTSLDFMEGSSKIAYVNNQSLYITKAVVKQELQMGETTGFVWKIRDNGNMGLMWLG